MNTASDPAMLEELLVEDLRDLLHAEGQLVKALPKMAKAAKSPSVATGVRARISKRHAGRWNV